MSEQAPAAPIEQAPVDYAAVVHQEYANGTSHFYGVDAAGKSTHIGQDEVLAHYSNNEDYGDLDKANQIAKLESVFSSVADFAGTDARQFAAGGDIFKATGINRVKAMELGFKDYAELESKALEWKSAQDANTNQEARRQEISEKHDAWKAERDEYRARKQQNENEKLGVATYKEKLENGGEHGLRRRREIAEKIPKVEVITLPTSERTERDQADYASKLKQANKDLLTGYTKRSVQEQTKKAVVDDAREAVEQAYAKKSEHVSPEATTKKPIPADIAEGPERIIVEPKESITTAQEVAAATEHKKHPKPGVQETKPKNPQEAFQDFLEGLPAEKQPEAKQFMDWIGKHASGDVISELDIQRFRHDNESLFSIKDSDAMVDLLATMGELIPNDDVVDYFGRTAQYWRLEKPAQVVQDPYDDQNLPPYIAQQMADRTTWIIPGRKQSEEGSQDDWLPDGSDFAQAAPSNVGVAAPSSAIELDLDGGLLSTEQTPGDPSSDGVDSTLDKEQDERSAEERARDARRGRVGVVAKLRRVAQLKSKDSRKAIRKDLAKRFKNAGYTMTDSYGEAPDERSLRERISQVGIPQVSAEDAKVAADDVKLWDEVVKQRMKAIRSNADYDYKIIGDPNSGILSAKKYEKRVNRIFGQEAQHPLESVDNQPNTQARYDWFNGYSTEHLRSFVDTGYRNLVYLERVIKDPSTSATDRTYFREQYDFLERDYDAASRVFMERQMPHSDGEVPLMESLGGR